MDDSLVVRCSRPPCRKKVSLPIQCPCHVRFYCSVECQCVYMTSSEHGALCHETLHERLRRLVASTKKNWSLSLDRHIFAVHDRSKIHCVFCGIAIDGFQRNFIFYTKTETDELRYHSCLICSDKHLCGVSLMDSSRCAQDQLCLCHFVLSHFLVKDAVLSILSALYRFYYRNKKSLSCVHNQ